MTLIAGFEHIVRENEPLAPCTWLRIGGPAQYFAEPTSIDELQALVARFREQDLPVRVLGGGSNLVVRDEGVPGLVLRLSAPAFSEITVEGTTIRAGGGAKLGHLVSTAVREGLAGLEQLVGIPGTVGGALHGNAGTENCDIGQSTIKATVLTRAGEVRERGADELSFSYRQSSLNELAILSAEFGLEPDDVRELTKRMQTQWIIKRSVQPESDQNAALIFKNPGGLSADSLIEQAGLKGTRMGKVEVSDKHANFMVAEPGASSNDVIRLIELVKGRVSEFAGVELETEIEIW